MPAKRQSYLAPLKHGCVHSVVLQVSREGFSAGSYTGATIVLALCVLFPESLAQVASCSPASFRAFRSTGAGVTALAVVQRMGTMMTSSQWPRPRRATQTKEHGNLPKRSREIRLRVTTLSTRANLRSVRSSCLPRSLCPGAR